MSAMEKLILLGIIPRSFMTRKQLKRLMQLLFFGTVGGKTRLQIVRVLEKSPYNANQLAELLGLHYTTIRHHLTVLEKNRIVISSIGKYGKVYFLSDHVKEHENLLREVEGIIKKRGNVASMVKGKTKK